MRMYVAGEWSDGAQQEELRSPYSGETIDTVPVATVDDVDRAIASAVRGGGHELADEGVLAARAVLEVDQQPVEAGQRTGLRGQRAAQVQERAQRGLADPQAVAQPGTHPYHLCASSPVSYWRRFSASHGWPDTSAGATSHHAPDGGRLT